MLIAYTPVEITLGRFFFYGVVSAAVLIARYRQLALGTTLWARAAVYGFAGNIHFSVLVSFAVQDTGAEVMIPIIGLLRICVSVAGNRSLPAAAWRRLLLPFIMVTGGLCIVLVVQSGVLVQDVRLLWRGVAAVVVTVAVWTWYALSNAQFLRENPLITVAHWSCAIGVATFMLSIAMALISSVANNGPDLLHFRHPGQGVLLFVIVAMTLGVGASWLATVLFNRASLALPMGLVGQLIVLETIFGITYACIYKHTVPPVPQAAGMILANVGIWLSTRELLK